MYASRDGIIEDYVGNAGALSRLNSTDTARVQPVKVAVNGYILDVTSAHDLYVAPVVTPSPAVTYYICAVYDPATNVADSGGGRSTLGPVTLQVLTSLPTAGGKVYYILYSMVRAASQLLSATALTDARSWIGPTITTPAYMGEALQGPFARGSVLIQTDAGKGTGDVSVRVYNGDNVNPGTVWQSTTRPPEIDLPTPAALVAADAFARYYMSHGRVWLRGTLKRNSGAALNNGSDVILGTLPEGCRPNSIRRFSCSVGTSGYMVGVKVEATGVISMYDPAPGVGSVSFVDLSSINFRAEN
jgi:hypothetical protein